MRPARGRRHPPAPAGKRRKRAVRRRPSLLDALAAVAGPGVRIHLDHGVIRLDYEA